MLPCRMSGTVKIFDSKEMADTINNIKKLETFLIVAAITLGKGLSSLSTIYDT